MQIGVSVLCPLSFTPAFSLSLSCYSSYWLISFPVPTALEMVRGTLPLTSPWSPKAVLWTSSFPSTPPLKGFPTQRNKQKRQQNKWRSYKISRNLNKLISHASKVMLKILQVRLQQYMNRKLPDVQAGFRKGRGTRDQIANIRWIIGKAKEFQKNIYFCFIDYAKAFDCGDHNKLWKIQTTLPVSWEMGMQVKKQKF